MSQADRVLADTQPALVKHPGDGALPNVPRSDHPGAAKTTLIRARQSLWDTHLGELWEYRELILSLASRDVKVRYKQSVVGLGWAIFQPVATMLVFTLVFSKIARLPSSGLPYPVFSFSALIVWTYFAAAFISAIGAIVDSQQLITKVYFPRVVLIIAALLAPLLDLALSLAVFLVLLVVFHLVPGPTILVFPLFVLLAMALACGCGLLLSTIHAHFRDVRTAATFALQLMLFATPVAYASTQIPTGWPRIVYRLNPIAAVVEGSRWSLTGRGPAPGVESLGAALLTVATLVIGLLVFNRLISTVADVV